MATDIVGYFIYLYRLFGRSSYDEKEKYPEIANEFNSYSTTDDHVQSKFSRSPFHSFNLYSSCFANHTAFMDCSSSFLVDPPCSASFIVPWSLDELERNEEGGTPRKDDDPQSLNYLITLVPPKLKFISKCNANFCQSNSGASRMALL